jgi:hypothetical protein
MNRKGLRHDKAELSSLPARTDKRTRETSRLTPLKGVLKSPCGINSDTFSAH